MNMAIVTQFLNDLFNALSLGAVLIFMPLGVGFLFFRKNEADRGLVYIVGMCAMLAAFELVYLPFFFMKQRFTVLTVAYFVLAIAASVGGWWLQYGRTPLPKAERFPLSRSEKLSGRVFLLVFLWQALRLTAGAGTWNIDDAWYLAIANDAIFFDSIMCIDPTTGIAYDYASNIWGTLDYIFSPWPLFWAMFAKIFSFPITVLMRTVLPFYFLAIFYYIVYRLALLLFRGCREKALFALCLLSIFYELSAVAMNLRYTWIICYPWMGKGFGPSVICPAALFMFLLWENEEDRARKRILWLGIFLANLAGCVTASSCAELNLIVLGCWGLVSLIEKRDFSIIWKLGLCVSPSLALMAVHFI